MFYLRRCLEATPFVPGDWPEEDKNVAAFRTKEAMISWFCQPPGDEPHRDRGFYCRELSMLSRTVRPNTIVEFGTSLGQGVCLLRWLNPDACLVTVDIATMCTVPGIPTRQPIGCLAKQQGIVCEYVTGLSYEYALPNVDFCFVDANHSYESVLRDSERAWLNRAQKYVIAWHDYGLPGVKQAVQEFCAAKQLQLLQRSDSDTVWVWEGV